MGKGKATKSKTFKTASKAASKTIQPIKVNTVQFNPDVFHSPTSDGETETPINGVCRNDLTASCTIGHSKTRSFFDDESDNAYYRPIDFALERQSAIESGELDRDTGNLINPPHGKDVEENTKWNGQTKRKPKITKKTQQILKREIRERATRANSKARGRFKRKTRKRI